MNKVIDITGVRFGRLIAIRATSKGRHGCIVWKAKCDCGKVGEYSSFNLRIGKTKSCGCFALETQKRIRKDLTGTRFGNLVVRRLSNKRNKHNQIIWECICDCGKEKSILSNSLVRGDTTSCGCYRSKSIKNRLTKDLIGKSFGNLMVIKRVQSTSRNRGAIYKCKCSCGNSHIARSTDLIQKKVSSCGCYHRTRISIMVNDPEFRAYTTMRLQMAARNRRLAALSNADPVTHLTLE